MSRPTDAGTVRRSACLLPLALCGFLAERDSSSTGGKYGSQQTTTGAYSRPRSPPPPPWNPDIHLRLVHLLVIQRGYVRMWYVGYVRVTRDTLGYI